ncbi:MAG TPA: autotransporter-associated beta strand repeat-containing protein, partial [Verrucomicrobiae bacterium]
MAALASVFFAQEISAQTTNDWVDGTSTNWSDPTAWSLSPQPGGVYETNIIRFLGSSFFYSTNDLSTTGEAANTFLLHQLIFSNGAGGILSGNTLRFTNDPDNIVGAMLLQQDAGGIIISNAIDLASGLTLGGDGAGIVTNAGVIGNSGGTFGLTKNGSSKFVLQGANTFGGAVTINAGVLNLQNSSALGSSSGASVAATGAALELEGGISIGSIPLTLNGGGVSSGGALRNISGANSYAGAINLGSSSRINSDANLLTLTGGITGTGKALAVGGSGNTLIGTSGINTGTGGTLTKDGSGTLTITASGTYDGLTAINGGAVNIQNNSALGVVAGGVDVANGGALQLQGGISVGAEALTLRGLGVANDGALRNISGSNNYAGFVTLTNDVRINSDAGAVVFSGGMSNLFFTTNLFFGGSGNIGVTGSIGLTNNGTVVKDGTGTLALVGNNSFSNRLIISNGTVYAALNLNALGVGQPTSSNAVTLAGGNLNLANDLGLTFGRNVAVSNNTTLTSDRITAGAGVIHTNGNLSILGSSAITVNVNAGANAIGGIQGLTFSNLNLNSPVTFFVSTNGQGFLTNGAGPATLLTFLGGVSNGANTITVDGTGTVTFGGAISNGAGGINKNGAGTLILSVANTYLGDTFISNGIVQLGNGAALGANSGRGTVVTNTGTLNLAGNSISEPLTLSGAGFDGNGVLINSTGTGTLTGPVTNAADATYSTLGGNVTISGVIAGPGALIKVGANTLTLTGNDTYTGATIIHGGGITVSGVNGRLTNSPSVTINNTGTLTLGANSDPTTVDHLPDSVALTLNRGTLAVAGSLLALTNRETVSTTSGIVLGGGLNTITLTPATGREVELATDSLTRNGMATLLVRGTALGSNGNGSSRFFLTNTVPALVGGGGATDSMTISIVPWLVGDVNAAGTGNTFVTYDANGLRP